METIGERVKYLRESRGLSQQAVADGVHSSRSHISSIEINFRYPSDILVHALCDFFSVRENWLRTGELPIREQVEQALKDEIVSTYFGIAAELSPSMEVLELFLKLMQVKDFSYMVNYLCYRALNKGKNEIRRMAALFDVAFPDYRKYMEPFFLQQTEEKREAIRNPLLVRTATIQPAGKAAAGSLLYDDASDEVHIALPEKYLDTSRYKYIEVQGDSMEPRIRSGDYVVVAIDVLPEHGELALVYVNDHLAEEGYLIKKYQKKGRVVQLISLNDAYPPIEISPDKILGIERVVYIAPAQGV